MRIEVSQLELASVRALLSDIGLPELAAEGDALLREVTLDVDGGGVSLEAASGSIPVLRGRLGEVAVELREISARGLSARAGGAGLALDLAELRVERVELEAEGWSLRCEGVAFPAGLHLRDGELCAPRARLRTAAVRLALGSSLPLPRDAGFLDGLDGRLELDATVVLLVYPLVKPALTSFFRIPIQAGEIDFKALERDFHELIDAVIDFEVEGDRLILEKDFPLVPWDNTTLVSWPLDAEARALAAHGRVRLATLLRYDIKAAALETADSKGAIQIKSLQLAAIALGLRLRGQRTVDLAGRGSLVLGSPGSEPMPLCRVRGRLDYCPPETSPNRLEVELEDLQGALRGLALLGLEVDAESFRLRASEQLHVAFSSLTPTGLRGNLRDAELTGLRVRRADSPG